MNYTSFLLSIIILPLVSFSHKLLLTDFHWRLNDSKFSQISWTPFCILADLNNAVVWMVSILLPISNSSIPFSSLIESVPSAPTTIVNTVTSTLLICFFLVLGQGRNFAFIFNLWSAGTTKSTGRKFLFFFYLISTRDDLLTRISLSVCFSKSQRIVCVSFSRTHSGLCLYRSSCRTINTDLFDPLSPPIIDLAPRRF